MGRPKKETYDVSCESYSYAKELIHDFAANNAFCQQYEKTHSKLLKKTNLDKVYGMDGVALDDIQARAHIEDNSEKQQLETYLDKKKKVFLVLHPIKNLMCDDKQMQAVAEKLFLEGATIQYINLRVEGRYISERTVAREKKRAIAFIAQYIDSYFEWEVLQCFL